MKRAISALCVFLLATGVVYGTNHTWSDGGSGSAWSTGRNWVLFGYPDGTNDNPLIDKSQTPTLYPVVTASETIGNITMKDGTSAARVTIDVNSSVTLTVNAFSVLEGTVDAGSYVEIHGSGTIDVQGTFQIVGGSSNSVTLEYAGSGSLFTS